MKLLPFNPLIGFVKPPFLFLIILPIITIALVFKSKSIYQSIFCMIILFIASYSYITYQTPKQILSELKCNRGNVTILYDSNTIAVIDPGAIGQTKSAYSWIAHTLFPHITSTTGKASIDYLILLQPNKTTLAALCDVIKEFTISTILVPELQSTSSDSYKNLQVMANKVGTKFETISTLEHEITYGQTVISLLPQNRVIKNNNLTMQIIHLNGKTSDNQFFSCRPYKEKANKNQKKRTRKKRNPRVHHSKSFDDN